jgi:Ca2+-binding EF-hand superfamily protein
MSAYRLPAENPPQSIISRRTGPRGDPMQFTTATPDELQEIFERIDDNDDGSVSFAEFRGLMHEIGDLREDAVLHAAFERVDINRDGRIDFEEMRAWLCAR